MGLSNGSLQDVTAKRRELVASLRLRGHTEREIVEVIAKKSEYRNPVTGKAWTNGTIHNDLVALRQEWRAESMRDIATHKAQQLAEIREARKKAWEKTNLLMVARFLEMEIKLLGTDAPIRLTWIDEAVLAGMSENEASTIFNQIVGYAASLVDSGSGASVISSAVTDRSADD
jgi:hypothetical protein